MASRGIVSTGRGEENNVGASIRRTVDSGGVERREGDEGVGLEGSGFGEEEGSKKKKKKKKLSKTERQRRKEEEAFKKIYGPKDSHIQLISSAVLQKLNESNSSRLSKSQQYVYSRDEFPSFAAVSASGEPKSRVEGGILEEDFPALSPVVKPSVQKLKSVVDRNKMLQPLPAGPSTGWEIRDLKPEVDAKPEQPKLQRGLASREQGLDASATKLEKGTLSSSKDDEESGWETENENPVGDEKAWKGSPSKILSKGEVSEVSKSSEPVATSSKKKSKNPFVVSLDALITVNKSEAASKRREAKKSKVIKKETNTIPEKKTVGNALDASGPVLIKRGKMREKPKKKKVSALKKAILMSRALRASKTVNKKTVQEPLAESPSLLVPVVKAEVSDLPVPPVKVEVLDSELSLQAAGEVGILQLASVNVEIPNSPLPAKKAQVLPEVVEKAEAETRYPEKYFESRKDTEKINVDLKPEVVKEENVSTNSLENVATKTNQGQAGQVQQDNSHVSETDNVFAALLDNAVKSQEHSKNECKEEAEQKPGTVKDSIGPDPEVILEAKKSLHSRKFRPYCNMYVSKELHGHLIALMKELHRFQDRLYHTDPIKFQSKRRYVHGLKDTINYLEINKVCLVVLAPDVEANDVKGGLDDKISTIIHKATSKNIPIVFSGNRFILGKLIMIKSQVSAIAILDKQGAEELFRTVINEAAKLREKYGNDLDDRIQQILLNRNKPSDTNLKF